MTKPTYTPQRDSVAAQVCGYLTNNPVLALSLEDITDKFDAVRGNIHTLLAKSVEAGLLLRCQNEDGDYMYQPGPELLKAGVDIDTVPTTRTVRANTYLDPADIQITNDPLPAGRALPVHKYTATFDALKPGQSIRCSSDNVGRVTNALRKYLEHTARKGQIKSTRRYPDDEGYGRVWLLASPVKALMAVA